MMQSKNIAKAPLYMLFHISCSIPFILACNIFTVSLADGFYTWQIITSLLVKAHMQGWNY